MTTKILFMKINGDITLTYKSKKDSQIVFDSLEVDNENYLTSKLNNNTITYSIKNTNLGSFLATVDDLIASEITVEKILNNVKK
jgi:hypothetical protein